MGNGIELAVRYDFQCGFTKAVSRRAFAEHDAILRLTVFAHHAAQLSPAANLHSNSPLRIKSSQVADPAPTRINDGGFGSLDSFRKQKGKCGRRKRGLNFQRRLPLTEGQLASFPTGVGGPRS